MLFLVRISYLCQISSLKQTAGLKELNANDSVPGVGENYPDVLQIIATFTDLNL